MPPLRNLRHEQLARRIAADPTQPPSQHYTQIYPDVTHQHVANINTSRLLSPANHYGVRTRVLEILDNHKDLSIPAIMRSLTEQLGACKLVAVGDDVREYPDHHIRLKVKEMVLKLYGALGPDVHNDNRQVHVHISQEDRAELERLRASVHADTVDIDPEGPVEGRSDTGTSGAGEREIGLEKGHSGQSEGIPDDT